MRRQRLALPKTQMGELFRQESASITPNAYPNELFLHYSLPAYDEFAGPITEPGRLIESNKTLLNQDVVLVSKLNPRKPRVQLVRTSGDHRQVSSTEFIALAPRDEDIHLGFFKHLLASSIVQGRLAAVATGTTNSHVRARPRDLLSQEIAVPPLYEQRRIAAILDTLDDQTSTAEKIRAKLGVALAGLTHDLLSADDVVSMRPLGELAEVASGVTLGHEPTGPGTVSRPYLRVANVQDGHLDLREIKQVRVRRAELSRFELKPGDVLMNEGGDADKLGRGAVWQGQISGCLHQNHVFRVRCDTDELIPEYLSIVSGSTIGKRYFMSASKQTTNLASINSTQIKAFPVPLRSIEGQRSIVEAVRSISARIDEEQRELAKLRLLKAGLMADLLTGRVRVRMEAA
jgi:type I restriction enzyme S subunit